MYNDDYEEELAAIMEESEERGSPSPSDITGMPLPSVDYSTSPSTPEGSPTDDNLSLARGNSGFLPTRDRPEVIDLTFSPAKPSTANQAPRRPLRLPLPQLDPQPLKPRARDDWRSRELASIFGSEEGDANAQEVEEEAEIPMETQAHRVREGGEGANSARRQGSESLTSSSASSSRDKRQSAELQLQRSLERLETLQRMEEATEAAGLYVPALTSSRSGFRPRGDEAELISSSDDDEGEEDYASYQQRVVTALRELASDQETSSSSSEDDDDPIVSDSDSDDETGGTTTSASRLGYAFRPRSSSASSSSASSNSSANQYPRTRPTNTRMDQMLSILESARTLSSATSSSTTSNHSRPSSHSSHSSHRRAWEGSSGSGSGSRSRTGGTEASSDRSSAPVPSSTGSRVSWTSGLGSNSNSSGARGRSSMTTTPATTATNAMWSATEGRSWPTRLGLSEEEQIALAIEQSLRDASSNSSSSSSSSIVTTTTTASPFTDSREQIGTTSFEFGDVRRSGEEGEEEGSQIRRTSRTTNSHRSRREISEVDEEENPSNDVSAPANAASSTMDDEAFALALQRQFEEEASKAVMSRLEQQRARVLRRTNVDVSAFLGYSPGSHFAISSSSSSSSLPSSGSSSSRSRSGWRSHARTAHIDPDRMSYEELLELGERMGEVKKKGASSSQIRSHTQLYTYKQVANNDAHTRCSVCISDFEEGDEVRMLPCIHVYHKDCIDKWLKQKVNCPVCQRPITGSDSS